ncbi:Multidrug efflux pump subunit AcrB [Bacillus sp. OV194]|nr:Multidrug efflux pump subunit AcrB [Bacillus sp. OV194]
MMKSLIDGSMKRAVLIITLMILIIVWGAMAAREIQRDYLPEINNSTLTVSAQAENYQADQMKLNVTKPIEQGVRVVDGLQGIETSSSNGSTLVRLNFPMSYDMEKAEAEVNHAIETISLPASVKKPVVTRLSTNSFPIMSINLTSASPNVTENTLRTMVQEDIVSGLKTVPGVKEINVTGGGTAGYALTIDKEKLKKAGLTVNDLQNSMEKKYTTELQGNVSSNQASIPVQVSGWSLNKQELLNLPVQRQDGPSIPLSKVADISNSVVNLQTISRTDGLPSVRLDVLKTSTSNITDVGEKIRSKLKTIPELKNNDVKSSILFDQSEQVNSSLKGLVKEGVLGCLFAMICVFLFFRQVRSTLLIVLSLPICLLATIGVLKTLGISLNILTVSGLIVAMGRVVDDSIVILDNLNRKVQETEGKIKLHQLSHAVSEMIPAIVSSTATTIAVYVPIALIRGIVSSAFSGFAWSVVIALIVSLLVAMLIVPTLYNLFWKGRPLSVHDPLEPLMHKGFKWMLHKEKKIIAFTLLLFLITGIGAAFLPVNFLPMSYKKGQAGVRIELPQSVSLREMDAEVKRVEGLIKKDQHVGTYSSVLGSSFTAQSDDVFDEGGGWIQKPNVANLFVTVNTDTNLASFIENLQKQLDSIKGKAVYTVTDQRIAGDDSQLKINFTGSDHETLESMAHSIGQKLVRVPGLAVEDIADDEASTKKYHIHLDQKAIERNGIKVEDLLNRIQFYTAEGTKGQISINQHAFPVVLKSKDSPSDVFSALGSETFKNDQGQNVRLDELATLEADADSSEIQEKDGQPFAEVTANITSSDIGGVTKQVKSILEKLPLPQNISYSFAGIPEQVNEMIYEIAIAFSFSLLLVLFIIGTVFRGWKAPLSVLVCIPLAFIGSVAAMFIFRLEWNLAALVGLLMLTGIVVTNGIVLVDKIERKRAEGLMLNEAIVLGTSTRVRPILTTALTTVLTVLPLALSSRTDSVISQTLGIVVIGGLISSTFISLIVIPIVYKWLHKGSPNISQKNITDEKMYA